MGAKHTPTPWEVAVGNRGTLCVIAADAWVCGELSNGNGEAPGEGEANAHFIVRACNAYDEMLTALKAVAAVVDDAGALREGWKAHKAVLAAIELAEQAQ